MNRLRKLPILCAIIIAVEFILEKHDPKAATVLSFEM